MSRSTESTRRRLHLLRHAKSSWGDAALRDFDRPLDRRGERAAAAMAVYARQTGMAPKRVICSPALRTRMTWAVLATQIPAPDDVDFADAVYGATPVELATLLRAIPSTAGEALLIGHNPGLARLAAWLASGASAEIERLADKFPTGALASFSFDGEWADLARGACALDAFVTPKQLL